MSCEQGIRLDAAPQQVLWFLYQPVPSCTCLALILIWMIYFSMIRKMNVCAFVFIKGCTVTERFDNDVAVQRIIFLIDLSIFVFLFIVELFCLFKNVGES